MPRLALPTRAVRWILAPALPLLLVLVGLAVDSEDRSDFETGLNDDTTADEEPLADGQSSNQSGQTSGAEGQQGETGSINDDGGTDPLSGESVQVGPEINFEVRGDDGSVGVRLDPTGADVAFPRTADGESGLPTELTADGLPADSGYRLTTDGRLEVVPVDDTRADEIVLDPGPVNGVDLTRGDGSRIEIRSGLDDEGQGLTTRLTEVDADGVATPLEADDRGRVDIGDGISVQLPTPEGQIPPAQAPDRINWRWFLAWIASMVIGSLGLAFYLWRTAPPLPYLDHFQPPAEVPVTRFVDFLTVLRMDPDPSRAIRLAFEGAEQGLGSLAPREPTETPFEWHARVAAEHSHLDGALGSLCSRFTTARFAPERPTIVDRDGAIDDLEQLAYLAGYHELVGSDTLELVGARA